jgi:RNA polymerase sigma-70 factor (ECF subfamily)
MTTVAIGGFGQGDTARRRHGRTTSVSLLRLVQADDHDSWEEFVDLYGPLVYRYCGEFSLSHDEAGEIVQEVMLYLIDRRLRGFRHQGAKGAFRKWLRCHTRGRILDRLSQQREERRMFREYAAAQATGKGDEPAPGEVVEPTRLAGDHETDKSDDSPDFYGRIRTLAAAKFQSHVWEAFERTAVLDHPTRQVAASLGMKVSNVRNAKFRVVRWLRTVLAEELGICDSSGDSSRG